MVHLLGPRPPLDLLDENEPLPKNRVEAQCTQMVCRAAIPNAPAPCKISVTVML